MAGEARNLTENNVRVKIDNVRKVFNTRNGEMVALNGENALSVPCGFFPEKLPEALYSVVFS